MEHLEPNRLKILLAIALASIVIGGAVDLALDQPQRWLSFHVVFEALMITGALLMATTLWLGWWRSVRSVRELRRSLEDRQAERDAWRESAHDVLHGLGHAIDRQFDAWELTPAERQVALLLLKGHSHKTIARKTRRGDQTVRQHAASVYRKAALSGRAELSGFFLEDLMLPADDRASETVGPTEG
jgi:DNA-binding CsgD family transcriptional regulator